MRVAARDLKSLFRFSGSRPNTTLQHISAVKISGPYNTGVLREYRLDAEL